jgi:hypothetical protein
MTKARFPDPSEGKCRLTLAFRSRDLVATRPMGRQASRLSELMT